MGFYGYDDYNMDDMDSVDIMDDFSDVDLNDMLSAYNGCGDCEGYDNLLSRIPTPFETPDDAYAYDAISNEWTAHETAHH